MEKRLSPGSKFRNGLADMGFARITSAMQFFLLFYYTGKAGIDPALVERKAAKLRFSQHKGLQGSPRGTKVKKWFFLCEPLCPSCLNFFWRLG